MKTSIKKAVEGWQYGKLTDNEFVKHMNICGCYSVSSNDESKTFSKKNEYGSDVIFEVYSEKFFGHVILLTGYTLDTEKEN